MEFSESERSQSASLSSCTDDIKDTEAYQSYQKRKCRLYTIGGLLFSFVVLGLILTFIFIFVLKKGTPYNLTGLKNDTDFDYTANQGTVFFSYLR